MTAIETGAGFRIVGAVVRKYVGPTGKFASLVLSTPGRSGGEAKHDLVAFDAEVIDQIHQLPLAAAVQVTGNIDNTKLVDKQRNDIKVDGFVKWIPRLVIKKVTTVGPPPKNMTAPAESGDPDDSLPF